MMLISLSVNPFAISGAPMLAKIWIEGANFLVMEKLSRCEEFSSACRILPTPSGMLKRSAVAARCWLSVTASRYPPVMDEIIRGAPMVFPRNVVERSISESESSGKALCTNSNCSRPVVLLLNATSPCKHISTWLCFRSIVILSAVLLIPKVEWLLKN